MITYEVHFIWNGIAYKEQITTNNINRAKQLIRGRYAGCKITSVRQVK
jgi:hypothetical protein